MKIMKEITKVVDFSVFNGRQRAFFALCDSMEIAHETYQHPPVFTVEEGDSIGLHDHIPGQGGKSLLVTNDTKQLWLVVARDQTRVNLKELSRRLDTKRFSFAKPEIMQETMGVSPGSATPFALEQDAENRIQVILDQGFFDTSHCVFHPMDNRFSTVLAVEDLVRFLTHIGHEPQMHSMD